MYGLLSSPNWDFFRKSILEVKILVFHVLFCENRSWSISSGGLFVKNSTLISYTTILELGFSGPNDCGRVGVDEFRYSLSAHGRMRPTTWTPTLQFRVTYSERP
jgi:hypothetical protein